MRRIVLFMLALMPLIVYSQDVIVMNDGSTVICKVLEIGTTEVKYKKFSNLDGPLYSISRSDIQNINFENGDREKINDSSIGTEPKVSEEKDLVLNYGTSFPIQIVSPVRAKDLSEGDYVSFITMMDIDVDGVKVIRAGAPVNGIVYKAKRSSWWGTKGKLGVRLDHLLLPDGKQIPIKGDIYVTGKNRTALAVLLFLFVTWPACFICGSKAELPYGFDTVAKIGATVHFTKGGKATITNPISASLTTIEPQKPQEPLSLSSLDSIPPLPCNATLFYTNGKQKDVQIEEINQERGVITCKFIFDKNKGHGDSNYSDLYTIKEKKLYKIEFENNTDSDNEDNPKLD